MSYNNLCVSTKTSYYNKKFQECGNNQREMYSLIKVFLPKQIANVYPDAENSIDLANKCNTFFVVKVSKIVNALDESGVPLSPRETCIFTNDPLDKFVLVTDNEISKIISSSPNKSCALDPIPTSFIKQSVQSIAPVFSAVINSSFKEGYVPSSLKSAIVTPILKKSGLDTQILKNYRPISNLSFLSKTMERVVANRLSEHLNKWNLLNVNQSAYREGHSTETALIKVHNDILRSLDEGHCVILLMLDLSAAFDVVNHEVLLRRLKERFGIVGLALAWIQSYLSGRTQRVCIDGSYSDELNLTCGVPQGSVLGPILFSLFTTPIGDIGQKHNLQDHFYADDSQYYVAFNPKQTDVNRVIQQVENCVKEVRHWMLENRLKLNDDKTELIVFTPKRFQHLSETLKVTVGDIVINTSSIVRDLGVLLDDRVSMESHVLNLRKQAYFQIRTVAQIRPYINTETAKTLMRSLVLSRLDYCNSLLYGIPKYLLNQLQVVQNTAARIIYRLRRRDHITPALISLHWLPIDMRIRYKILLITFKCLRGIGPIYLASLLSPVETGRSLRSSTEERLVCPLTRTNSGSRAFSSAAPVLWNALPSTLQNIQELDTFKNELKHHLFVFKYET